MNLVRPGLYIGSHLAEKARPELLARYGVRKIIYFGREFISHLHLTYIRFRLDDNSNVDLVKALVDARALQFMASGMQRGATLICCESGMTSSATAVLLYLMRFEHLTFKDALVDLMKCRKFVQPNIASCNHLIAVEACQGRMNEYNGATQYLPDTRAWYNVLREARVKAGV